MSVQPIRIVSGGQTGVDRAALDVALALGLPVGGWCPAGRWAEDGPLSVRYPLRETRSADPAERTRLNVRDSDATLIFSPLPITGGTHLTARIARDLGRPLLMADLDDPRSCDAVRGWIGRQGVGTLNVAGPRESESPGSYARSYACLTSVLKPLSAA